MGLELSCTWGHARSRPGWSAADELLNRLVKGSGVTDNARLLVRVPRILWNRNILSDLQVLQPGK